MRILFGLVSLFLAGGLLPAKTLAQSSTITGDSRALNPAISVNGLFRGQLSSLDKSADLNGFQMDGVEAQFSAMVDPYWKAKVTIGIHPEHAHDSEESHGVDYATHVEEAFLDNRTMPGGLALRAGRFLLPYGKHKPLHMHQFPFADQPVAMSAFLGDHGLSENGVQLGYNLPVPWFSDLIGYGVAGDSEIFDAGSNQLAWGGRLANLWDVSEDATMELSGSFLSGIDGHHPGEDQQVDFWGVDLTYKWFSSATTGGPAVRVTGEMVFPHFDEGPADPSGWYALAEYRFQRSWWAGIEMGQAKAEPRETEEEAEGHDHAFEGDTWEYKLNLTFAPSEFSFVRAEAVYYEDKITGEHDWRGILQANFTIGSHPAHTY